MNLEVKGNISKIENTVINNKDVIKFTLCYNKTKKNEAGKYEKIGEPIWINCSIWEGNDNIDFTSFDFNDNDFVEVKGYLDINKSKDNKYYLNLRVENIKLVFANKKSSNNAYSKVTAYEPEPETIRNIRHFENDGLPF
jgi:hypothetical protein